MTLRVAQPIGFQHRSHQLCVASQDFIQELGIIKVMASPEGLGRR